MEAAASIVVGPGAGSRIVSYVFIGVAFLIMITNIIVTGINIGNDNTNQSLRKYVGLSFIPVVFSLIFLGIGMKMYFAANPGYLPYAALILSLIAIGVSQLSVCISLIEKGFVA